MSNALQTIHLAIQRALNEAPHARGCRSWRVLVPDMTRDELENGGAERRILGLELREKSCTCYRSDLEAALDLVNGYPPTNAGICRVCACTEVNPCMDIEADEPCAWADESQTLCTVCYRELKAQKLHDEVNWFYEASIALGDFVGMPWAEWLACSIGRLCRANGGPYLYDALCFVEKGLVENSAEALYIDAIGDRREYLLGRFESIATITGVSLDESPAVAEAALPAMEERQAS